MGFKETLAQLEQDADREIEELKEMPLGFQDDLKSVTGSVDILYDCIVAHAGFRVARIVVKPCIETGMNRSWLKRRMTRYDFAVRLAFIRSITLICTLAISS